MRTQEFPEQTTVYAKDQPQYNPLPCYKKKDDERGEIICCWGMSWKERITIFLTGKIWHRILTFNHPLQPQKLLADKPDMAQQGE